jgi:FG-GAP repeat
VDSLNPAAATVAKNLRRSASTALGVVGLMVGVAVLPVTLAGSTNSGAAAPATVGTLLSTLPDPGTTPVDEFGYSVAASGNQVVVGAPSTNSRAGTASIYLKGTSGWSTTPTVTLQDPGATSGDGFGSSVAISGNIVVIGAIDAQGDGAAYIYVKSTSGYPTRPTKTLLDPAATALDWFGSSVAISGTQIVIGAFGTDSRSGAAYIYTKGASGWPKTPSAALSDPVATTSDSFGSSVAISGSTALIGAYNTTVGSELGAGTAYIYIRSSDSWPTTPSATLNDPAATAYDWFGSSVALSGSTAVIGAWGNTQFTGAAYIYTMSSGSWPTTPSTTLSDPGASVRDYFGESVGVSGKEVAVGAYGTSFNAGTTYLYAQGSGSWPTTPTTTLADPMTSGYDYFGYSVAVSKNVVVGGAFGANSGAGATCVFEA